MRKNFYFSLVVEQLKAVKQNGHVIESKPAVKVREVIGSALPRVGPYKKLDNTKQVVALIDDVSIGNLTFLSKT